MRRRRAALASVFLCVVAACDSGPRPEPVVVYASYVDDASLPAWFTAFTKKTGIPVTVKNGESETLTANVIHDRGSPPADVLLTGNVADIWRAADRGALRPIQSSHLAAVPESLKDADGFWVALDYRRAVIIQAPSLRQAGAAPPRRYADLAEPAYRGQVCLASSAIATNRSVIAMLVADLGDRAAELIVRGWVQNLALPPFDTESQLAAAVASGSCAYGIIAESFASGTTTAATTILPQEAYIDIEGVGVARHARYPESAQRLVDWILAEKALTMPDSASTRNVGLAGWGDEDARRLAERASYR